MFISLIFNSIVLVIFNFILALYFGLKFLQVLKNHYKFVSEIKAFNSIVCESRSNLDFTTVKLSEAIKAIETDIGNELKITHDLTKFNTEMKMLLKRLRHMEQKIIELVKTNCKMEDIMISTPTDINREINKISLKMKKK
ncbi:uncharacterized protein [Chelonus insularis]|uniref:uncharacterized protein n=1 Tax=Chelonus insularis TaxID=460826 RepID=UPI00158F5ACF|nr:uncharacterized protein LOC118067880 [Chelonus insularis]